MTEKTEPMVCPACEKKMVKAWGDVWHCPVCSIWHLGGLQTSGMEAPKDIVLPPGMEILPKKIRTDNAIHKLLWLLLLEVPARKLDQMVAEIQSRPQMWGLDNNALALEVMRICSSLGLPSL